MQQFTPWDHYPSLKEERLITLGSTIQKARNSVVPLYDPEAGDNVWSAHCRAYARQCSAIRALANDVNWLKVSSSNRDELELSLLVEDVTLKIFRGEADSSPNRHRDFSRGEQILMEQLFIHLPTGPIRLVVTTAGTLRVSAITLVQFDGPMPWRGYQIPLDEGGSFSVPQPDPTSPPPILPHSDDRGENPAPSWRVL